MADSAAPNILDPQTMARASAEVQALLQAQGTMIEMQRQQIADLTRQLEWFRRRQVFGPKSERLALLENAQQLSLGEGLGAAATSALPKSRTVVAHTRRLGTRDAAEAEGLSVPFFDETRVLPLYRQHQRLKDCGITVTRPWLTQTVQHASALLEPIYEAQLSSIRDSRVKAMDETPIKAGRSGHGKMRTGYFWPLYGERDDRHLPPTGHRSV